jgi:predicted permease
MTPLTESLFRSLVPIFVLVMFGYALRRLGAVGEKGSDHLSRTVLLFFFPILVFHRLAMTEDASAIMQDWLILVWAFVVLPGSGLIGWVWHALSRSQADRRVFVFSIGMPNWIYLPLAIAGPLWGDEAVRLIILFNIPTQLILWTAGVGLLRGTWRGAHALKYMLLSPGMLATVGGLLVAFGLIPVTLHEARPGWSLAWLGPALHTLGGLTIPLSVVGLGLYLGEKVEPREGERRQLVHLSLARLLIAPLMIGGLLFLLVRVGMPMTTMTRWVLYLIVSMPVAVSVPLFARMFDRDRVLGARAVVVTTLAGFITSPLLVIAAIRLEQWLCWLE